jgi:hypothetical protein
MKRNALACLFSVFLLTLLSSNTDFTGEAHAQFFGPVQTQGNPESRPAGISRPARTPSRYLRHAQQATPEPRPAEVRPPPPPPPPASAQGPPESKPQAQQLAPVDQAAPEPRPPEKKKDGSAEQ